MSAQIALMSFNIPLLRGENFHRWLRNGEKCKSFLPRRFPLYDNFLTVSQEAYIAELDAKSGASLKLTVLNPYGRIWTMVAGGGASVIYRWMGHKLTANG